MIAYKTLSRRLIGYVLLAWWANCAVQTVLADPGVLEFLRERQTRRYEKVSRHVLAFYYTWYGRPERHGRWIHWGRVDPDNHEISESTHYPTRGAYDSHDPAIIDWHIDLAKNNGVTGFISTWWGQRTFDDRAFEILLERAKQKDFKVTVYWETAPGKGQAQVDRAIDDLLYILRHYGSNEAFLRVDGKPVIFVYGRVMGQVPMKSWPAIIRGVRQGWSGDVVLIADGYDESYARIFDGVHTYNICGWVSKKSPSQLRDVSARAFADAVDLTKRNGKISCLTVIPGYDDTKIRRPGLRADRLQGETYQILWEEASGADPDWILITSWNEWHEGSEIEPSWEDGDKYIQLTGKYAARFRATPYSQAATSTERRGPAPDIAAEIRRMYAGKTIGILPDFGGEAVLWLADTGVALRELTWTDLSDPRVLNSQELPLILYTAGEHYVRSVRQDNDVVAALQRYLRDGGFLVVIPSKPYPFYYDETGRPNIAAGKLGLPIPGSGPPRRDLSGQPLVNAWETPPPGRSLVFYQDTQRLPGLPATAAFPSTGDLRWRPATKMLVSDNDVYVPLVELKDERGRSYGDAVAYVEHKTAGLDGGRTLYVWMRIPDVFGHDTTFRALFGFAADQLDRNARQ